MKTQIVNRTYLVFILATVLIVFSTQGTSYGQTITASTPQPLTEANLHGSVVTLTLSGRSYAYRGSVSVSGIDGVAIRVNRVSDTKVTAALTFSGNLDTDTTLTFTVSAEAIAGYNEALTAQVPVTAIEESLVASTASPLTEATLHGSVVTLTLSGRSYAYRGSVSVSGIDGVAIRRGGVRRVSDTEITAALTFSGNVDTDTTLTFTVSAEVIAGYNEALTAQVPVTAIEESLVASTASPLTEATLHGSVVTLTLSGRNYVQRVRGDTVTVSGIDGVTVGTYDVDRVSDTEATVELTFDGDFDTDATLTLTVGAEAIAGYNGQALAAQVPVTAIEESLVASTASPLTEATLHGSVVTLTLSGRSYAYRGVSVSVSGIDGVAIRRGGVRRVSDTEMTAALTFSGNLDTDTTLTFTVSAEVIAGYNEALTAQVPVTAVEESLVASTASPLTEATLHGSVVTLTLSGRSYAYRGSVSVSGIDGVAIRVRRVSDTEVTAALTFSGNLDTDATLTFTVSAEVIAGYNEALTAQVPVTAVEESLVASTASPLTEANLHESVVTLTLIGRNYEGSNSDVSDAVTVSGIDGVTFDRSVDMDRVSDTVVTIELEFAGNIDADGTLTFTVGAGAIAGYSGNALTATLPVTAVEESIVASTQFPLTETNLHGSVVTLTLSGRNYAQRIREDTVTVSGIDGVTFERWDVKRISDTEVTVELTFDGDFDADATLTFSVGAEGITRYNGQALTTQVPVTAVEESLVASTASPLTEANLHESVVTLTLIGRNYEGSNSDVRDAVTVSGIDGVTFERWGVERISDTEATVELIFNGDFDTDATLTFTVGAEGITRYNGQALTAQVPVTAMQESLVASTDLPLTEATLHGSIVTLTLNGGTYEEYGFQIEGAPVSVSGIEGVTLYSIRYTVLHSSGDVTSGSRVKVDRISDTEARVKLTFDGTDFDTDATLTFTVRAGAIARYNGQALTAQIPVTAIQKSNATVSISPSSMLVPAIGEQLTLSLNIANGENVAGYQAIVSFDNSLRHVESANGDYLPANAFFGDPIVRSDWLGETSSGAPIWDRNVTLAASALAGVGHGDGTLATLTFRVIDFKASTLTLSQVYLIDSGGKLWEATTESGQVIVPPEPQDIVFGDINHDSMVNLQDLVIVHSRFGQTGYNRADVNGDRLVDIADLVLVAGAFDEEANAPSLYPQALDLFTAADLRRWLSEAQQLALTDPAYLRGITVLEQLHAALIPQETALLTNYPNPFNPETWIPYRLAEDALVMLTIYDGEGQIVRTLEIGHQIAGYYTDRTKATYWDGRNEFSEQVASGVYFYHLSADDFSATRKMLILK